MRLIQILDRKSVITKYTNTFTFFLILNELATIFKGRFMFFDLGLFFKTTNKS